DLSVIMQVEWEDPREFAPIPSDGNFVEEVTRLLYKDYLYNGLAELERAEPLPTTYNDRSLDEALQKEIQEVKSNFRYNPDDSL
ncbi:hypothetical protein BGZ70_004946, partial [Mortierella alpina]